MHRRPARPAPVVAVLLAAAVVLTGCQVRGDSATAEPTAGQATSPSSAPFATSPASTPAASPNARPSTAGTLSPSAAPTGSPAINRPAPPTDVAAVQRTLADLRYYAGAIDGRSGPALRSAVMAFQKVQGLGVDGSVGPKTRTALAAPKRPALRDSGPADRVEVDLSTQVLYVVKGGSISRILPVSSGNGARYSQKSGGTARALTPTGTYRIERRIVGVREADLGSLYDPQYFYRGWAIHGSNSVPAYPASHGCVRVTRADATYLLTAIGVGTTVHLYGGTHVFGAGSSAAGTSNPTGDTSGDTKPVPTAKPVVPALPSPTPAATKPAPTKPAPKAAKPAPAPPATEPAPKPSPTTPTPMKPAAKPSASVPATTAPSPTAASAG